MTRICISGCSGGGKSTLLAELARRGHSTVAEPGRIIVRDQIDKGGDALPWLDAKAFLDLALAKAIADFEATAGPRAFFDRGLVDAAVGLARLGHPQPDILKQYRYDNPVFLAPPWADLFANDDERQHSFDDALAEYDALATAFPALGYKVIELPKLDVASRADFVENYTQ
ncbi:MAG: AAA family ATPase [Alphaproteobacteria bacterium]